MMKATIGSLKVSLLATAAITGMAMADQAIAAVQPADANAAAEASGEDEIIITAQRREERLQDVPITISNFSSESLEQANVQQLSEVAKLTSGVRFDKRTNFVVPTIRGITTPIVLAGGGSNIGVYLDGFYTPALQSADMQLMNIESIQVLKGPQGTLFGRNTNGGAILVNSADPSTDPRLDLEAAYGNHNAMRWLAYTSVGLADRLAVDFAASFNNGDGWITNIANGDDEVGKYHNASLRFGVKVDVTDNFSLLARYSYQDVDDPTNLLQVPYLLNGVPQALLASNPAAIIASDRGDISGDEIFRYIYRANVYQLSAKLDLGFATITSYTQYREDRQFDHRYSLDYTNLPLANLWIQDFNDTFTQEVLLTSKHKGPLQYTFGVFYFWNDSSFPKVRLGTSAAGPFNFIAGSGVHNKSIAAYGDVTYEVIPGLFLTAGLRYTHDRVDDAYYQTQPTEAATTRLPPLTTSRVTPRAVIRYAIDDHSSIYASYAKGYKAAIYNVGGFSPIPIKPEGLDAFEVGYKRAERNLTFNISGYYYNYRNQQLVNGVLVNGVPVSRITNAATSHLYGIEADVAWKVSPAFQVSAGGSWSHARYTDFPGAPIVNLPAFSVGIHDGSGNHMQRAPDFTAHLGANYTVDVGGGTLDLSGNLYYTSKFFFDAAEQFPQDSYATVDARVAWTDPSDKFVVALSAKNLTGTKYYSQVASNAFGVAAVWAPPASIEASLKFRLR